MKTKKILSLMLAITMLACIFIMPANAAETEESIKLCGMLGNAEIYLTDSEHNCEKIYEGKFEPNITVPAKSIMTVCVEM